MLNIIWYILRPFYLLGLLPACIALAIGASAIMGSSLDRDVGIFLCIGSLVYFGLGYWHLKIVPDQLRYRLLTRAGDGLPDGFKETWSIFSVSYTSYLGVDTRSNQIFFFTIDGKRLLLDFNDVLAWELDTGNGKGPLNFKILTSLPSSPVIILPVNRSKLDTYHAYCLRAFPNTRSYA